MSLAYLRIDRVQVWVFCLYLERRWYLSAVAVLHDILEASLLQGGIQAMQLHFLLPPAESAVDSARSALQKIVQLNGQFHRLQLYPFMPERKCIRQDMNHVLCRIEP